MLPGFLKHTLIQPEDSCLIRLKPSLADLCHACPNRIRNLFAQLDLTRQGLEPVQAAVDQQDWVTACETLLSYYQNHATTQVFRALGKHLSLEAPMSIAGILADTFTFQGNTATVPHCSDHHLDWAYQGPDQDPEWAWFLNRHYQCLNLLDAYQDSRNPAYTDYLNQHLLDWITSSTTKPGQWWAQWRGREIALRVRHWASLFYGLSSSGELSPAVRILMLSSLLDHAHHLRHLHHWRANWLSREMSGLAAIALCWSEFKMAPQWLNYATNLLLRELDRQVYPDGVHKELTSHYHRIVLQDFQYFAELLNLSGRGVPAHLNLRLEQMHNYLAYSMCPQGHNVLNNDSDESCGRSLIQAAATTYQRSDWTYIVSQGKTGQKPAGTPSRVFPWAGQVISRNGWDQQAHWSFFDVGPLGIDYHVHYDQLHLSVAAYGRHLLVDSGRYRYQRDHFWRYFRHSVSHNVILVDGKGQGANRREWQQPMQGNYLIAPSFDFARGTFDGRFLGLAGKAIHTRTLLYVRGKYWVVVDRIQTDRPRRIEPLWHFHPDCTVEVEGESVVSVDPGVGNLRIVPAAPFPWQVQLVAGQDNPVQGWWSREYNHRVPNPTAVYSATIESMATFVWMLYPALGRVPAVAVTLLPSPPDLLRLRITVPGQHPDEITVSMDTETCPETSVELAAIVDLSDKLSALRFWQIPPIENPAPDTNQQAAVGHSLFTPNS
jgi:hypothetical protein